jgi:hypothetical protein
MFQVDCFRFSSPRVFVKDLMNTTRIRLLLYRNNGHISADLKGKQVKSHGNTNGSTSKRNESEDLSRAERSRDQQISAQ